MKLKIKALLLAFSLALFTLGMSVCAEEETDPEELMSEAVAGVDSTDAEDSYKELLTNYLSQISDWSDEQVDAYMESDDEVTALVSLNWSKVMEELGRFEEVTDIIEVDPSPDGYGGSVQGIAAYDGVGKGGTVYVTLDYVYTYSSTYSQYMMNLTNITWSIDYTLGSMMQKAALNTLMGICIVFLGLAFLSFLISRIKYIPELMNRSKNKKPEEAPAEAGKESSATAEAPALAEETAASDDQELVAVISAAVAAYEEAAQSGSGDTYVVRSIKRVNNKNRR